jgi:hypothetical protein
MIPRYQFPTQSIQSVKAVSRRVEQNHPAGKARRSAIHSEREMICQGPRKGSKRKILLVMYQLASP